MLLGLLSSESPKLSTLPGLPRHRALSPHPVQGLAKLFAQRPAAGGMRLFRKLTNGEVRLLLADALLAEGYTLDLHYRST
jgi:hypothetical protein